MIRGSKVSKSTPSNWAGVTPDSLQTQLAAYYSLSDSSYDINKKDMTIFLKDDKRRIYGGRAADYAIADTDWRVGTNFNLIKSGDQSG